MNITTMCLLQTISLLCVVLAVAAANNSSRVIESRYKCPGPCDSNSTSTSPSSTSSITYKARSKIECAVACSKTSWCSGYNFNSSYSLHGSQTLTPSCVLLIDDGSSCPISAPDTSTCFKVMSGGKTRSEACILATQKVFEMNDTSVSAIIDPIYLQHLYEGGNEIKIEYVLSGVSYTLSGNIHEVQPNGITCVTVADFSSAVNSTHVPLIVRSFCSNGVRNAVVYNSAAYPSPSRPSHVSWMIQRRSKHSLGNGERVYTTGGVKSLLIPEIESGFSFKLLMSSGTEIGTADIIFKDQRSNDITVQTTYLENNKMNVLSLTTSGIHEIVKWNLRTNTVDGPSQVVFDVTWVSDSCWTHVYTSNSSGSAAALNDLVTAADQGQSLRVGFDYKDTTIYANAKYVGVSGTQVIAHVMNIGSTKNSLILPLPLLNQILLMFTHAVLGSSGHATLLNVDVSSASTAPPQNDISTSTNWFVGVEKYRVVHTSEPASPVNSTTLADLVAAVDSGSDVKVRMTTTGTTHLFKCDTLQIISGGQNVTCQVNDLLAMDFLLPAAITTPASTSTGILGGLLGGLLGSSQSSSLAVSSGCSQYLVFTTAAVMTSYISCVQQLTLDEPLTTSDVSLEWLVLI